MKCTVLKRFDRRGIIHIPGSVIEVPENMLLKMADFIEPIGSADSYHPLAEVWPPTFKAWLEDGALRTTGVCDDLAAEIRNLTADNMPLQAKLLRLHCGRYSGPGWYALIGEWRERAAFHFEQHGLGLHEANYKAAEEMSLLCFADELKLKHIEAP